MKESISEATSGDTERYLSSSSELAKIFRGSIICGDPFLIEANFFPEDLSYKISTLPLLGLLLAEKIKTVLREFRDS
jgi:hypothetical protein